MLNEKVVIYKTDESEIAFEKLNELYVCDPGFIHPCLQDELIFRLGGPQTYTLKRKKLRCKRKKKLQTWHI